MLTEEVEKSIEDNFKDCFYFLNPKTGKYEIGKKINDEENAFLYFERLGGLSGRLKIQKTNGYVSSPVDREKLFQLAEKMDEAFLDIPPELLFLFPKVGHTLKGHRLYGDKSNRDEIEISHLKRNPLFLIPEPQIKMELNKWRGGFYAGSEKRKTTYDDFELSEMPKLEIKY